MITKTCGYQSSDGMIHGSLVEAQKAELVILFKENDPATPDAPWDLNEIADWLVRHQQQAVDILTMKPSSKPRARKINGGTKARAKKSTRHEAEQIAMPFVDNNKPAA